MTKKAKTLRKQQQNALRSKSRGFISNESSTFNSKKKFDDHDEASQQLIEETSTSSKHLAEEDGKSHSNKDIQLYKESSIDRGGDYDDDGDDEVEEVTASAARDQVEAQTAKEELAKTVILSKATRIRKKRKHSSKEEEGKSDDEEEELDESFFAQLEKEKMQRKQETKRAKKAEVKGKHTVFDAVEESNVSSQVADGIRVQVLPSENAKERLLAERQQFQVPSSVHDMIIPNGIVEPTEKKKNEKPSGWVRSNRMKHLSCGGRRRGKAAVNFCKR